MSETPSSETVRSPATSRRWRRWLPRAVFESVLIVFSVVLALALTDWAEARRIRAEVAEARGYFISEIRANRALVRSDHILAHHHRLRNVFIAAAQSPNLDQASAGRAFNEVFETGIHIPPLRDAVWRSAEAGDLLGEMPLEELFLLSDIYAAQQRLTASGDQFISGMPSVLRALSDDAGARSAVTSGQLFLGDLVAAEEELLRLYDEALRRLDAPGVQSRDAATGGG